MNQEQSDSAELVIARYFEEPAPSKPPICGECGMELWSWSEYHTVRSCAVYKRFGLSWLVRLLVKQPRESA